jgi:putative ABC transport system ATP-binding protein
MIEVKNVFKIFPSGEAEIVALNDVSFNIPEGQFVTISGRSGSGKSTLLYQLGLLDTPSKGQIIINGVNTETLDENEKSMMRLKNLGYIFQDYAILPTLTAFENVLVPLLMLGFDQKDAEAKAKIALEKIGLGDRMHNLPSQLSGGQQQRVSIARAIAHAPQVLFADEPTANLDSETSDQVIDVFLKLNAEGQTIVMVTHEPEYASLSHRTIMLADGKIVSDVMNK